MDSVQVIQAGEKTTHYVNNTIGREGGPAIECPDYTAYIIGGMLHRTDGSAYIKHEGGIVSAMYYYNYGVLHRPVSEGHAVEFYDENGLDRDRSLYYENGVSVKYI